MDGGYTPCVLRWDVGGIVDSLMNGCAKCWASQRRRELKFELEKTAQHCSHASWWRDTLQSGHHGLSWMSRIGNEQLLVVTTSMNNK